ncbi:hypothetical protein V502_04959 [Pseudogymnoascus sp. VKM F-4520 (FW-2644)]|nr:hypothetical protein V502_04959 [Pseudogymnoascus sp. VKM F-4520 (FW-2644)]
MFGFGDAHNDYQQAYNTDDNTPNEAKFSHEAIAGAAAFAGFKGMIWLQRQPPDKADHEAFEDKQRNEGKPVSHQFAKELLAGLAGAEVDRLAETKGMDFYDKERAHHQAKEKSNELYEQHYGQHEEYNPQQRDAPQEVQQYGRW